MGEKDFNTIDRIVELFASGDFPTELEDEVRDWLAAGLHADEKENALWKVWKGVDAIRQPDAEKVLRNIRRELGFEEKKTLRPARLAMKIAAVVVPLLVLAGVVYMRYSLDTPPEMVNLERVIMTGPELKRNLVMADGTELWLNSESELKYSDERNAVLKGEAWFDVQNLGGEKFTVTTEHIKATVLGTTFNIRDSQNSDIVTVSLYEGRLEISVTENVFILEEGHEFCYHAGSGIADIYPISRTKPDWMRDIINFEDMTVNRILRSLEEIYGVVITGDHPSAEDIVTLKIEGGLDLDEVMFFLSNITGDFRYEISGKTVNVNAIRD